MKCGHENWATDYERIGVYEMWRKLCRDCGHHLPLGPANDESEAVRCEIRAVELATERDHWMRLVTNGIPGQDDEVDGFIMHCADRAPRLPGEWAGWLAREIAIATHDEEH